MNKNIWFCSEENLERPVKYEMVIILAKYFVKFNLHLTLFILLLRHLIRRPNGLFVSGESLAKASSRRHLAYGRKP